RHGDAARRTDRSAVGRAYAESIPLNGKLGSWQSEHLDDTAEFEGAQSVVGDRRHQMILHGVIISQIVFSATGWPEHRRLDSRLSQQLAGEVAICPRPYRLSPRQPARRRSRTSSRCLNSRPTAMTSTMR